MRALRCKMARLQFGVLTFLVAGFEVCFVQSENTAPRRRVTPSPTFLQTPQQIHYFVSRNQQANLTWVATNVCKMQIKCNGKKFDEGENRVCGKTCRKCRTRRETRIINVSDFPGKTRSMTCQCKVWGTTAVRTEKIIVEKAFLRRNFGSVQLEHVAPYNTSVILQCKPPVGSPSPNVTWYKNGEPLFLRRGRRVRVNSKKDLVIRRLRSNDSGKYKCVAQNMVARREGLMLTLEVRENISTAFCNESHWWCSGQSSAGCNSKRNTSSSCDSNPPMLVFGTQYGLYTADLRNTSKVTRTEAKNVVSVDFSWDPNLIYWSDKKGINRFSLHNGVNEDMPFRLDVDSSLEGIAIDWVAKRIYWTDAMHNAVYVGDLGNGRKVKLIEGNLDFPRAIVLNHSEGYMYWTDWGPTPKIERARLDGTERQTFISSGIQYPNGLALDESDKMLYWAGIDANKYGIIEALSLDGLNRTVIFYRPGYHPFSLDIFEGFVYWSDWGKNAVLRINKTDGGGEEVIVGALNKPMGLKILHGRGDLPDENPCDKNNGNCDHLCLYQLSQRRQTCFCKEGFKVDENGKTCQKLNLRRAPESREKPSDSPGTPLLMILFIIILLLGATFLLGRSVKKRCSRPADQLRMSRVERVEDQEMRDESLTTDHTELFHAGSQLNNNDSSNLSAHVRSAEHSGACAVSEDSSDRLQRSVVVYMTKVEVEQHGGVTVVGDDAKVHHHYSPPN